MQRVIMLECECGSCAVLDQQAAQHLDCECTWEPSLWKDAQRQGFHIPLLDQQAAQHLDCECTWEPSRWKDAQRQAFHIPLHVTITWGAFTAISAWVPLYTNHVVSWGPGMALFSDLSGLLQFTERVENYCP